MFKFFGSKKHPKGPNWSKAKEHCLDFSGTKLFFTTPPNNHSDFKFKQLPTKFNLYDQSIFHSNKHNNEPSLFLNDAYEENWEFKAFPYFSEIGWLAFRVGITRNKTFGDLNSPMNFISAINERMNYSIGPLSGHFKEKFEHVRKNWCIQRINESSFVHYEQQESNTLGSSRYWRIALTSEHHLYLVFHKHIYKPDTDLDLTYNNLIEKILSTIRIEWSEDALKQQAEAKQKWPDQKLPESLPELTWSDEEWLTHETDDQRKQREFAEEIEGTYTKHGNFNA